MLVAVVGWNMKANMNYDDELLPQNQQEHQHLKRLLLPETTVHTRWFKVTFLSPIVGAHLDLAKGRLTIPKRSQRIARYTTPKFNIAPQKWWLEDYFPIGKVAFQGLC